MADALVRNSADKEQLNEAEKKIKGRKAQELAELAFVMQTATGRRFVMRRLVYSQVMSAKWGSESALQLQAGRSEDGARLWQMLMEIDSALFVSMLTEWRRENKGKL